MCARQKESPSQSLEMKDPKKTKSWAWKEAERRTANWFSQRLGRPILRQRLSGSSNRPDETSSDTTDPCLYIEVKYRQVNTVRNLHDKVASQAKLEDKIPLVVLFDNSKPGFLVCIHSDSLERFCDHMNTMQPTNEEEEEPWHNG